MHKSLIFIILITTLAGGGANFLLVHHLPDMAHNHVLSLIHNTGFTDSNPQPNIKKPNILIFKNIDLDGESFSTIKTIKLRHSLRGLLNGTPITDIKINGLNLTGDGTIGGAIDIAGLNSKHIAPLTALNQIPDITISNSNIDIFIPSLGGINLHYDLQLTQNNDSKDYGINGHFSGKQKQLNISGAITGRLSNNGDWDVTLNIEQGKFNHPHITATRLSGFVQLSGSQGNTAFSEIQLTAGGLTIFGLPWHSANTSIRKRNEQYIIIAEGKSIGQRGIEFGAQLTYTGNELHSASGTIHAQKASDILNYLNVNDIETIQPSPFTSLDKLSTLDIEINTNKSGSVIYSVQAATVTFETKGERSINNSQDILLDTANAIVQTLIDNAP